MVTFAEAKHIRRLKGRRIDKILYVRDSLLRVPPGRYTISDLRTIINNQLTRYKVGYQIHFGTIRNLLYVANLIEETYPRISIETDQGQTFVTLGLSDSASSLNQEEKIFYILYLTGAYSPQTAVNMHYIFTNYHLDESKELLIDKGEILESEPGLLFIPEVNLGKAQSIVAKVRSKEAAIEAEFLKKSEQIGIRKPPKIEETVEVRGPIQECFAPKEDLLHHFGRGEPICA